MLVIDHTAPRGQRVRFEKDWNPTAIGSQTAVVPTRKFLIGEDNDMYSTRDFASRIICHEIYTKNRARIVNRVKGTK